MSLLGNEAGRGVDDEASGQGCGFPGSFPGVPPVDTSMQRSCSDLGHRWVLLGFKMFKSQAISHKNLDFQYFLEGISLSPQSGSLASLPLGQWLPCPSPILPLSSRLCTRQIQDDPLRQSWPARWLAGLSPRPLPVGPSQLHPLSDSLLP